MKTTAKHFEYFKKCCLYWADKFGLDEWELRFFHDNHPHISNLRACVETQYQGCIASVWLGEDWGIDEISDKTLDGTSKHEMIHLLIANFSNIASSRYVTADEISKAEEALVVKLCKLL